MLGEGESALRLENAILAYSPEKQKVEKLFQALTPRSICPACELRDKVTERALSALAVTLKDERMLAGLRASDGLCLPHFRMAIGHIKDESDLAEFVAISREKLAALDRELLEFMRKNNYQFAREGFGREGDSWMRVIGVFVGDRLNNSQPVE